MVLIMGLAATHEAWKPQILKLAGTLISNEEYDTQNNIGMCCENSQCLDDFASLQETERKVLTSKDAEVAPTGIQVCAFDNRGVGKSSAPKNKSEYTTAIMAMDAVALMDHLGWEKAHVFGHSLGAMISCKMAALVPERIASLALLSGTGGGYQCLPKFDSTLLSIAYRFWRAKSPEERAMVDLDTHYTEAYLDSMVEGISRREILYKEYVRNLTATGMQPKHGLNGQINAWWTHKVTSEEYKRICASSFLVSVIHGRGDVIAQVRHARVIAKELHPIARMVELCGGHLITHQNTDEVNQELLDLIHAAHFKIHHSEWSKPSALSSKQGCKIFGKTRVFEAAEEEDEDNSHHGCFAFLSTFYQWLKCGSCCSALKRLYRCFAKQKQ